MSKYLLLIAIAVFAAACGDASSRDAETNQATNEVAQTQKKDDLMVSSHGQRPAGTPVSPATDADAGGKSKWTQSGEPIDTGSFDLKIAAAERELKTAGNEEAGKKALAAAYYERAVALTDARQYASALGDYRRSLKLDPNNKQAQDWIEQIIGIYDSLNKQSPPEGEEPPPIEYKKGS